MGITRWIGEQTTNDRVHAVSTNDVLLSVLLLKCNRPRGRRRLIQLLLLLPLLLWLLPWLLLSWLCGKSGSAPVELQNRGTVGRKVFLGRGNDLAVIIQKTLRGLRR